MIGAEGLAETDFASRLETEAPACTVTEQTDGWVAFDIVSASGEAPVTALMSRLVNLNARVLAPGHATRTGLHHMSVFAIRHSEEALTFAGMRSLADSLWHALAETIRLLES